MTPFSNSEPHVESTSRVSPLTRFIGTGFFSGYFPIAPGTAGSAVGLILFLIPGFELWYIIVPFTLLMFTVGTFVSGELERVHGHDPSVVTIDEVTGMWISLMFLPKTYLIAITAFVCFRAYDIAKPFPAKRFDRQHGGFGIMLDDVVAGIYTNVTAHVLLWLGIIKS